MNVKGASQRKCRPPPNFLSKQREAGLVFQLETRNPNHGKAVTHSLDSTFPNTCSKNAAMVDTLKSFLSIPASGAK